jgi:hypothetical protein
LDDEIQCNRTCVGNRIVAENNFEFNETAEAVNAIKMYPSPGYAATGRSFVHRNARVRATESRREAVCPKPWQNLID